MSKFSTMCVYSPVARQQYHLDYTPHFTSLPIPVFIPFLNDKQTSLARLKAVGSWFVELVCWGGMFGFSTAIKIE